MLGTSLLFWGAMTGRPFVGLTIALAVEASHWTRIRWDFDDEDCGRAWQVTSIAIALATVLIWLDGNRYTALPSLLSWMPPLLLPMQFVQSYGLRDSLPLGMFSFLAKRRRKRNQRLGLVEKAARFNFGNVLLTTTMVASATGRQAGSWAFLPGLLILTGWALLATGRSRCLTLIPVLAVAGALALAGQIGLNQVEDWVGGGSRTYRGRFDPNFNPTLIGSRGTVQQSPDIVWRLRPEARHVPPHLLRTATFNNYFGSTWRNQRLTSEDFKDLTVIGEPPYYLLLEAAQANKLPDLPSFTLRGAASGESPLPLPGDAAGLRAFDLDGIERNPLGTVRVFPKHPVIDGKVFWKGGTNPEQEPVTEDQRVSQTEREAIRAAVSQLQLSDSSDLQLKLARLRSWFHNEFRYTRDLTISRAKSPTALTRFLTDVRAGHCEYFATAATLILREAGIPARYAIGYAVMERDPKRGGFVIRGTHGHAWCRVWNPSTGTWIDFDPTPPDWFAAVSPELSATQRFNDALKRLREDFFIWRNRPANQLKVSLTMATIGIGLLAFILKRLWRSKRQLEAAFQSGGYGGPVVRTPLHALEEPARKHLGPRPPGHPFGAWLAGLRTALPDGLALDEAIALHQRLRFDPASSLQEHHERLARLSRQLESQLKRT